MRLTDRRILIIGGARGSGWPGHYGPRTGSRSLVATRPGSTRRASIPRPDAVRLDVTSEEDAARAIRDLQECMGGLDVLINGAVVTHAGAFDEPEADRAAAQEIEINLLGTIRVTRLALPLLRRSDDGAVVLRSSALALVSSPGMAVYASMKAAVHSLARLLRAELNGEVKGFDVLPPWGR